MRLWFRVCADGTAGVAEQVIGGAGGAGGSDRGALTVCGTDQTIGTEVAKRLHPEPFGHFMGVALWHIGQEM